MLSIKEVYDRLKQKKADRREIKTSFKDALAGDSRYTDICEQIEVLKEQKKAIETEVLGRDMDQSRLEELNVDIKTDTELLADLALSLYVSGETVEITDEYNSKLVPSFKVTFKKS